MKLLRTAFLLAILATPALSQTDPDPDPGWLTDPPNPLNLTVTGDQTGAVESVVGHEGGRFELEDAAGNRFALSFPEGALLTDTLIKMTPIATSEGLPEGASPIIGLLLQPDGLRLARDAVLEIRPAAAIAPGDRLHWGFYGGGEDAFLHIPDLDAEGIVIPFDHFSGVGVSIADRMNMQLDRWRQSALEDRVSTRIVERLRATIRDEGGVISWETSMAIEDDLRLARDGYRRLTEQQGTSCDDVKRAAGGIISIIRTAISLGVATDNEQELFTSIWDKYWTRCFPEQTQICLSTGDINTLVDFALTYEKQRQIAGVADHTGMLDPHIAADLRQAMERCGRYKLEVRADGRWRDPSDVAGNLSFSADPPLRLEFIDLETLKFEIYGEAPATDVNVTFNDSACWQFHGHRNGGPMKAKIRSLEFRRDEGHGPLRMAIEMTAPEIFASISCDGYQMEPPMSPMVWAVAHVAERTGEVFRPAHWKPGSHPRLFTMDWTGQAVDDGLDATDTTTLTLVHIAQ